jgi:hypothetical protein
LCELNISQNIVYLWISESELTFRQKSRLSCPQNYIQLINHFKSDLKKTLFCFLAKATTNTIRFKVNINEDICRKLISCAQLSVNEVNEKYFEMNKENFLILFGFDLTEIVFYDNTKQYIKPEYPVLLQKPKLIVRKSKSYKIDYNNKSETLLSVNEYIKFLISIKCGHL